MVAVVEQDNLEDWRTIVDGDRAVLYVWHDNEPVTAIGSFGSFSTLLACSIWLANTTSVGHHPNLKWL